MILCTLSPVVIMKPSVVMAVKTTTLKHGSCSNKISKAVLGNNYFGATNGPGKLIIAGRSCPGKYNGNCLCLAVLVDMMSRSIEFCTSDGRDVAGS